MSDQPNLEPCDLLLVGGRVIDPETGLDAIRAVGVRNGAIVHIGDQNVPATETIDVAGLVVAPGFIDLHSHAQTISGLRLQALDGVTTSLELEGGALPAAAHYAWAESQGRPINFGYSAGWAFARMKVLDDVEISRPQDDPHSRIPINAFERNQDGPRWRERASAGESAQIVDLVRSQIDDGAIGVGVLAGYVPNSSTDEFRELARLAADVNQPLFVHSRSMAATGPVDAVGAVQEIIAASKEFDAPIHLCHMNSTSGQRTADVAEELIRAQEEGVRVTTETYPYSAGSTVIGAAFLAPDELERNHMTPSSVVYLPTGERVVNADRLTQLRTSDPGGLCVIETFNENDPAELALLMRALTFPNAAIASDAMPMTFFGDESQRETAEQAMTGDVWPLPDGLIAHPRSAGCFTKALSWLVRETGALDLLEAIRRATLIPADILADAAPAMRTKGRLQVGADADLTIFDPQSVAPQADYVTLRPSTGIAEVIVGGVRLVADGELRTDVLPGTAIRGTGAAEKN